MPPTTVNPDVLELARLEEARWGEIRANSELSRPGTLVAEVAELSATDRLKDVKARIQTLNIERSERQGHIEALKQALPKDADASSEEFKRIQGAVRARNDVDERLKAARDEQIEILEILSPHGHRDDGDHAEAVKALTGAPGALLSAMLERRKQDVATLPDHLRYAAAPMAAPVSPISTVQISTEVETDAVIDLIAPDSVAMRSGIVVLRTDTTKVKIPRFTDLPVADWIGELQPFPKSGPGIERVEVEPPKVGLVTELSIEVFEDLTPMVLAMIQVQILRAVGLAYDRGILFGSGVGDEPLGVANTAGIAEVGPLPLTNLGAFAEALAAIFASNALPGALVMNPLDLGRLLQVTESSGATESNVPLWKTAVENPGTLRLPYFGTPIYVTPACPEGEALMYDPREIIAVLRRQADIAIDPYYGFDNGSVGLRTYLRGDVVVAHAVAAVHITFDPVAMS